MKISGFVFIFIFCLCLLCGCVSQSINIKHDSPMTNFNNSTNSKSVVKKSSGVIIYKDISSPSDNNVRNINFGPKDIEFDLPMKMK